jgi:hypothetical protein
MAAGCMDTGTEASAGAQALAAAAEPGLSEVPGAAADGDGPCQVPGTLAYHVAQAAGNGKFDYDPAGELVQRVKGRYRERSGRFRWRERFHADSFLDKRVVRGQAASFGALQSLAYEVEATDVLDNVSVTEVEETWNGCAVERRSRPAGGTDQDWRHHNGSYDGATYTYLEEQAPHVRQFRLPPIILVSGTVFPDQSWIEYFEDWDVEYYQTRTGDGSGNVHLDWERSGGDSLHRGYADTFVDGSQHHYRLFNSDGDGCTTTWRDLTIGYDGHGSGTSQICDFNADPEFGAPVLCELSIEPGEPGQCIERCPNGVVNVFDSCL